MKAGDLVAIDPSGCAVPARGEAAAKVLQVDEGKDGELTVRASILVNGLEIGKLQNFSVSSRARRADPSGVAGIITAALGSIDHAEGPYIVDYKTVGKAIELVPARMEPMSIAIRRFDLFPDPMPTPHPPGQCPRGEDEDACEYAAWMERQRRRRAGLR